VVTGDYVPPSGVAVNVLLWHYKVKGLSPEHVAEGLFKPLVAEWLSFALNPAKSIVDEDTVVSPGRFTGLHGTTYEQAEAGYTHVWTVKERKITRLRRHIDTLAIAEARQS
jgi:ketosteroid isomerase-like protein